MLHSQFAVPVESIGMEHGPSISAQSPRINITLGNMTNIIIPFNVSWDDEWGR